MTFGKDNDGVIAPYIKTSRKKLKTKNTTDEPEQPLVNDDYEIGGFVDRSTLKSTRSLTPLEARPGKADDEAVAVGTVRQERKTRRPRSNNNNDRSDKRQVTGGNKNPSFKTVEIDEKDPAATKLRRTVEGGGPGKVRSVTSAASNHFKYADITKVRRTQTNSPNIQPRRARFDAQPKRPSTSGQPLEKKKIEDVSWTTQKNALKEKFKEGWQPRKKLSPDAMEGIRDLHEQDPDKYSTELLAQQFQMSPEAIRRILKSKWSSKQGAEKLQERRERWAKRHDRIWDSQAELGLRPPRTKDKEIEDPDKFEQDLERRRILGEI